MKRAGPTRQKLREWIRRYLPCEIAGTIGELGGAAIAYLATGSLAAAAITATIGASAGYYAIAYVSAPLELPPTTGLQLGCKGRDCKSPRTT